MGTPRDGQGGVALRIEGDDGTAMTKHDIAAALRHGESELQRPQVG